MQIYEMKPHSIRSNRFGDTVSFGRRFCRREAHNVTEGLVIPSEAFTDTKLRADHSCHHYFVSCPSWCGTAYHRDGEPLLIHRAVLRRHLRPPLGRRTLSVHPTASDGSVRGYSRWHPRFADSKPSVFVSAVTSRFEKKRIATQCAAVCAGPCRSRSSSRRDFTVLDIQKNSSGRSLIGGACAYCCTLRHLQRPHESDCQTDARARKLNCI